MKVKLLECVRLCGKAVKPFIGEKSYISTGALDENKINNNQIEKVTYAEKPSRANLQVDNGSVIFAKMQNTKKALLIDEELSKNIYSTGFFAFLPIEGVISQKCLFYLINSNYFLKLKDKNCSGATQKAITNEGLEKIELNVPTLDDQEKLVQQLKKINYLQDKYQSQLKRLDTLIKSRFVEMFGDIEAENAKVDKKPMTEVCSIIDGDRGKNYPKSHEFSDDGYCLFLNAKNVTKTGFDFKECSYITKEKDEILRNGKLTYGDVVLTTRGTVGNLAFYNDSIPFKNVRINSGMVILRMKKDVINEVFFIEQFKLLLENIKAKIVSGTAQPQLPISTMNKIMITLPAIEKQKEFVSFIEQVDKSKFVEKTC